LQTSYLMPDSKTFAIRRYNTMNTDAVFKECLHEMFRRVGLRYPNKKFTDQDRWYALRAWTFDDEDDFRKWMMKHLMKRMRMRSDAAKKEVGYFCLMYGWRLPVNDGALTLIGKEKKL